MSPDYKTRSRQRQQIHKPRIKLKEQRVFLKGITTVTKSLKLYNSDDKVNFY